MIQSSRNLLPLWDYGWCDHERITLSRCHSPKDVIDNYLCSNAFGTSFIGLESDYTPGIHGPFKSSSISDSDFELVTPQRFQELIALINQSPAFTEPPSKGQWQSVQSLVSEMINRHKWLFRLCLTENDQDYFHDFGFILLIFREFIFANPNSEFVERLVFGYD